MDLTEFATAGFALVGLVNGITFALERNWRSFTLFGIAVVAGTAFGFFEWFGLPGAEVGFLVGLSSSGVYKVAQKLGGT